MSNNNPFKAGDRVICIKQPESNQYQCKVNATATVDRVVHTLIYTKEELCLEHSNTSGACYQHHYFKLHKSISFKELL